MKVPKINAKTRCPWGNSENRLMVKYHDKEWGKPVYNDKKHFEMLTLEGAQAGLSWETILNKRENYRKAFVQFNPAKVAKFTKAQIEKCLKNPGLVRNRLKIESTVSNAKAFLKIRAEFGSFNAYIWQFVNNKPIINTADSHTQIPSKTGLSDIISKDLKKRGFRFVGSTIIYAYMQAIGMVDDHLTICFVRKEQQQQWYVYILQTPGGQLYTGVTTDTSRRLLEHQHSKKGAKYLRGKTPLKLVYKELIGAKAQALSEEHWIKKLSKKEKEALIILKKIKH